MLDFDRSPKSLFIDSVEYLFRGVESVHGGGHACIDAGLQKDLCHLLACDAIIQRSAHVQLDLMRAIQCGEHGQIDQASRFA